MENAARRVANPEKYRAYDNARAFDPDRIASRDSSGPRGPKANRRWRQANPEKMAAHNAVARALRSGKLVKPLTCDACKAEAKLSAHHDDYAAKLAVRWLCHPCHETTHHADRTRWKAA